MRSLFSKTIESPCRNCENEHLNKEDCIENCERLRAFQNALKCLDERNINEYSLKFGFSRN
jgi:hypothetical protein